MPVIMFDLFGTLIEKQQYDYNKALHWLADVYFERRFAELQKLSAIFKENYKKKRMISYCETSFLEQLKFFEDQLRLSISNDYHSVELHFMQLFRQERLVEGALELLQFLYEHQYRIYIFSNSLFSGNSLKRYLNSFGIDQYIEKVYSSADIGFRKPSSNAFRYVISDIGINQPEKVYYIGDSYDKDYLGARALGLKPILVNHQTNVQELAFDDLHLLLRYLKKSLE